MFAKNVSSGENRGWLKTLLKSAPTSNRVVSLNRKYLWTPRFTPHVPGPVKKFRLATAGLSNKSAPNGGRPKAEGLNTSSPVRFAYGSPVTSGRYVLEEKSPIASINPL